MERLDYLINELLKEDCKLKDVKVPARLVPKCPVCGEDMSVNLRCDDTFVEDDNWNRSSKNYEDFLKNNDNKNVLLLEFGVGFNTLGIIRFPFEKMMFIHDNFKLIRFNNKYPQVPKEIEERGMSIEEDICETNY